MHSAAEDIAHAPRKSKGRLGSRKTKTGCATCKKRRIKCDEEKPFCHRCTSTGRTCGGCPMLREVVPRGWTWEDRLCDTSTVAPEPCLTRLANSEEELQSLRFFMSDAAPSIAGFLDANFWTHILPQISESELAVRHALVAIGSLFYALHGPARLNELPYPTVESQAARHSFGLKSYHKAIKATIARLDTGFQSRETALLTCVLFFCIETLQQHDIEAVVVFEKGYKMLLESLLTAQPSLAQTSDLLQDHILPLITRLGHLSAVWSKPLSRAPNELSVTIKSASHFGSVLHARAELSVLLTEALNIINDAFEARLGPDSIRLEQLPILARKRDKFMLALTWWHSRLSRFLANNATSRENIIQGSVLKIHYHITSIWLMWGPSLTEMIYDLPDQIETFRTIIEEATLVTTALNSCPHKSLPFTLDMGLVAPLYWTILKCRHPLLRRKAIALFEACPRQEGPWVAKHCQRMALRVIGLEEGWIDMNTVGAGPNSSAGFSIEHLRDLDPLKAGKAAKGDTKSTKTKNWPPDRMRFRIVSAADLGRQDGQLGLKSRYYRLPSVHSDAEVVDLGVPLEVLKEFVPS